MDPAVTSPSTLTDTSTTTTGLDPSSSTSTSVGGSDQPSPTAQAQNDSNNGGSNFPYAPVIGGVLGGVVLIILLVVIIVPCARRRQKRLRWLTEGDGRPNVLRRDVEASEPLKGSYRDHSRRSSEDKHSLSSSGHHGSIPRSKSPYVNANSKPQQQPLAPVMEDVAMSSSSHVNAHFPNHGPPHASTTRLNPTSPTRTPRFPSLDRLWPLTSAFRTSLYSSPSTRTSRTKSSAASSAPSRSRSRNRSRRGRKEEPKHLSIDTLISPMNLQQGIGLGRDVDPIDSMQIKHVRGAKIHDARYETAPMLSAMSAQNNFFNVPPPLPSPTRRTPPGPAMRAPTPTHESQVQLRRDNSLTSGSTSTSATTYQVPMQPTTSMYYQAQPHLSRESSTRQPQAYPEPVRPSPSLRHPERAHHHSRSKSDGSRHKPRRDRERPSDFVQSSTLLPATAVDLGRPFQAVYPVGNLSGSGSRHYRQGSTSSNLDRQGSHRRARSRSRSASRTRSSGNHNTLSGIGHSHSRSLSNPSSVTPTNSRSGSRGEDRTGTGSRNGGSGSRLRKSAEHRRSRGVRPTIPPYEPDGLPPLSYGPRYEFDANGNGNGHYMPV